MVNWSTSRTNSIHKNYNVEEAKIMLTAVVAKIIKLESLHNKLNGNQEVV